MTAAVFGDFLDLADQQLQVAVHAPIETTAPVLATRQLLRVVAGIARYLDDCAPVSAIEAIRRTDLRAWERAAVDASMALREATACLQRVITASAGRPSGPEDELTQRLKEAAGAVVVGRDLLQTHLTPAGDGLAGYRTPWAPVITSQPVTRALASQVAQWCRPLARITAELASAPGWDAQQPAALAEAMGWLWRVGMATQPAQALDPVTTDDLRLLRGIPAAFNLARWPPTGAEPVAGLAAGVAVTAERLRAMVLTPAEKVPLAAGVADTWPWTARAAAITGHASELALRSLAGQPAAPPGQVQLQTAITAVATSWAAWRQVSTQWAGVATDTRGHTTPAATEIGDLMLRIGRMAWQDPQWTPARGHQATLRHPASLTTGTETAAVVAAVHQAADALAYVAAADHAAVAATDQAGRLYVTTRSLPEGYDVPRAYATAPADRTKPLLDAYQAAVYASAHAARSLATLALSLDAPSSTLALARAAATQRPTLEQDLPPQPSKAAADRTDSQGRPPGPVELAIRHLRVKDPMVLMRAVAIDDAAHRLISHVRQASSQGTSTAARPRPPNKPTRLAAQDSPRTTREALASRAADASPRHPPGPASSRRPPRRGPNATSPRRRVSP